MNDNSIAQMDDGISVQTLITSNVSRKPILRRWGVSMMVFGIGAMVISERSSGSGPVTKLVQKLDMGRTLYIPYDTNTDLDLPSWTSSLRDVWEDPAETDTPFFWYVPRAGGTTIVKAFSFCLGLTLASNKGINTEKTDIEVNHVGTYSPYPSLAHYVNVKTQNEYWIRKCDERKLLEAQVTDVFVSQFLAYAAENLFKHQYQARAFVMMRHPVKRAIDQFYYLQHATWERTFDAEIAAMSLEDFSTSQKMIENFEVRMLNGITDTSVEITDVEFVMAKEILRRKFVVGIFEWFDISMVRFEKYFGWWEEMNVMKNQSINNCHYTIIEGSDQVGSNSKLLHSEKVYSTIMDRNWADVELYHYAKTLFTEQTKLL